MRNASIFVAIGIAAAAVTACSKGEQQQNADQNIAADEGMPGGIPANADIETLPADESSVTPSNQLQNGIDAPSANESVANAE